MVLIDKKKSRAAKTHIEGSWFGVIQADSPLCCKYSAFILLGTSGGSSLPGCNARYKGCFILLSDGAMDSSARSSGALQDYYS